MADVLSLNRLTFFFFFFPPLKSLAVACLVCFCLCVCSSYLSAMVLLFGLVCLSILIALPAVCVLVTWPPALASSRPLPHFFFCGIFFGASRGIPSFPLPFVCQRAPEPAALVSVF